MRDYFFFTSSGVVPAKDRDTVTHLLAEIRSDIDWWTQTVPGNDIRTVAARPNDGRNHDNGIVAALDRASEVLARFVR